LAFDKIKIPKSIHQNKHKFKIHPYSIGNMTYLAFDKLTIIKSYNAKKLKRRIENEIF